MILVAGGTGGLGRATSLAFIEQDSHVIVTYKKQEKFDSLKAAAGSNGALLEGCRIDVTEEAEVSRFVEGVVARLGRPDALENTVGGYAGGVGLWELDTKVFDQMLTLNLRSG